jgi:hypothetical protein
LNPEYENTNSPTSPGEFEGEEEDIIDEEEPELDDGTGDDVMPEDDGPDGMTEDDGPDDMPEYPEPTPTLDDLDYPME